MSGGMSQEDAERVISEHLGDDKAEAFLRDLIGEEAWEKRKQDATASRQELREAARLFYDVFCTGNGPKVLEILKHKTVYLSCMDRAGCIIDGDIPLNPGEFLAGREMQNALIRFIERQINLAQEAE